jgi:hypothetical protein
MGQPPEDPNNLLYGTLASIERRFDRLENKVDERMTYVERRLQAIEAATISRQPPVLNWNIIIVALALAGIIAAGTYFVARLP